MQRIPFWRASRRPHAPRRRRAVAVCMLILAVPTLVGALPRARAPEARTPAVPNLAEAIVRMHLGRLDGAFPHLANYNGLSAATDVPAYLHDALIVAPESADIGRPSPVQLLEQANPYARILVYQRTLQVDYPLIKQLYGVDSIFPGWWLLHAGTVLTAAVSAGQTTIQVADPGRFQPFDDALVDGETMHVLAIRGSTLIVRRGFFSDAAQHRAGARIASHYSYRIDRRNSIISGRWENRRPWSFNLSSVCPRDPQGRTWADFLAERMAEVLARGHWYGVFFDNTDEMVSDPWVDTNNDNLPDGGVLSGRNVWHDGEMYLLRRMRRLAPLALIMDNGTLDAGLASNGREMEGFPLTNGLYMSAMGDYRYWERHSATPALTIINPDSGHSPRFDLGSMRFGLATALMGNGYYSYDEGWHRHGAVWNFDEYDDGAGSAALHDIGRRDTYIRVRRTSLFHGGDILLVGREEMRVVDLGTWNLIVQRGVNGTQATTHPAGTVVATPQQIAQGSDYLGVPLGPAYALQPPVQSPNLVANGGFHKGAGGWYVWLEHPRATHVVYGVDWTGYLTPSHGHPPLGQIAQSGLRDERAFRIEVPWQSLRKPDAISLIENGIPVRPRTGYTITFWARGTAGASLPVVLTGWRGGGHVRYAASTVTLHQDWYRYTLRYTAPSDVWRVQLAFLFGRVPGKSAVTGVQLQQGQALAFARRFSGGIALVNQDDAPIWVSLPAPYWHLRGDQDPALNDGSAVRRLRLGAHCGLILLSSPPA